MAKFFTLVLIAASAIVLLVTPTMAWDEAGHKVTAYIAWQQMKPDVRATVIRLLRSAPEDSQLSAFYLQNSYRSDDALKCEYFMLVATWPDIIRDKSFNTRFTKYANSNWHYADTYWTLKDDKVELVEGLEPSGLALQKLADFSQVIRGSGSDADKAIAIAWLEHLIGDIHQPLHAASRVSAESPKGDQGGNLFPLTPKGTPRDKQMNLHYFWDAILKMYTPNVKDQCDTDYLDPIAQDIMKAYPYDKMKDRLADDKFDVWAKESFAIASTEVYKGVEPFQMPSDDYKKKAFGIAQERMALAGYRMADLFNEVFAAPAPVTPPATTN